MKIAVFKNFVYPEIEGGTTTYLHEFCRELSGKHQVAVYSCTRHREKAGTCQIDGITHHRVFLKKGNLGLLRLGNRKKYYGMFREHLDEYDILNIQGIAFIPLRVLKKYRKKVLLTCHASLKYEIGYDLRKGIGTALLKPWEFIRELIKYGYAWFLEKRTFALAPHIIVMSDYVKTYISRMYFGGSAPNIIPIPVGIDLSKTVSGKEKAELRDTYSIPRETIVFFTLRRLAPRMGVLNLIEAIRLVMPAIEKHNVRFIIGGKGRLKGEIEQRIKKYGLEKYVSLAGYIPNDELFDYYRLADCFVLPTEELEGFGIVTIEALACDLPVIATNAGATPEIVEAFNPDLLADGVSPEAIGEKIIYFLKKGSDAFPLCSGKVEQLYSWPVVMRSYEKIFEEYI